MIKINQELLDRIKQLVDVSIGLLNWSDEYETKYNKYMPTDNPNDVIEYKTSSLPTLLRFQSSMMFLDVILNLNTLLSRVKKDPSKKEVSFFELLEFIPIASEKDQISVILNDSRKKLLYHKLDKIRNKFVGHKDLNIKFDLDTFYLKFPNPDLIKVCNEIVETLNDICLTHFNCITNNAFDQLYGNSHQYYLNMIEKSLKEMNN